MKPFNVPHIHSPERLAERSGNFSRLGLAKRAFKLTKALEDLFSAWQDASGEEKVKAKSALEAQLNEEIKHQEDRWRQGKNFGDYESKNHAIRMRRGYSDWATEIGIKVTLADL